MSPVADNALGPRPRCRAFLLPTTRPGYLTAERARDGIGVALVNDIVGRAIVRGFVRLAVTANPHAKAFCRRAGFVDDGTAETQFGPAARMVRIIG